MLGQGQRGCRRAVAIYVPADAACMSPFLADSVAKVPNELPISNNRIGMSGLLNQHYTSAGDVELILLVLAPKIVLQHGVIPASGQTQAQGISSPERTRQPHVAWQ
jgi:hypothetical protein